MRRNKLTSGDCTEREDSKLRMKPKGMAQWRRILQKRMRRSSQSVRKKTKTILDRKAKGKRSFKKKGLG